MTEPIDRNRDDCYTDIQKNIWDISQKLVSSFNLDDSKGAWDAKYKNIPLHAWSPRIAKYILSRPTPDPPEPEPVQEPTPTLSGDSYSKNAEGPKEENNRRDYMPVSLQRFMDSYNITNENINSKLSVGAHKGKTVLHVAFETKNIEWIEYLCRIEGINMSIEDDVEKKTPLHISIKNSFMFGVKTLVKKIDLLKIFQSEKGQPETNALTSVVKDDGKYIFLEEILQSVTGYKGILPFLSELLYLAVKRHGEETSVKKKKKPDESLQCVNDLARHDNTTLTYTVDDNFTVNLLTGRKMTALHCAAVYNDEDCLKALHRVCFQLKKPCDLAALAICGSTSKTPEELTEYNIHHYRNDNPRKQQAHLCQIRLEHWGSSSVIKALKDFRASWK
jgi:hypothetical protein